MRQQQGAFSLLRSRNPKGTKQKVRGGFYSECCLKTFQPGAVNQQHRGICNSAAIEGFQYQGNIGT